MLGVKTSEHQNQRRRLSRTNKECTTLLNSEECRALWEKMSVPIWYEAVLEVAMGCMTDAWKFQAMPTMHLVPQQRALDWLAISKCVARQTTEDVFNAQKPLPLTFSSNKKPSCR